MEFKDTLRRVRKENGYDRKELAALIGVSYSTISAYENGFKKPSYEILELLSDTLNVSVDELMGREKYQTYEIDPTILEISENIVKDKELSYIISRLPNSERCRKCTTVQFLCEYIAVYLKT